MLASLLPGLRDLRVPLAAGFLWLLVLWLMTYSLIPTKSQATGLAAEIYMLSGAFGPAALTAAISFTAYLIGILIAPPTARLLERWAVTSTGRVRPPMSGPQDLYARFGLKVPMSESTFAEAWELADRVATVAVELGVEPSVVKPREPESPTFRPRPESPVVAIREYLIAAMQKEVPLVATRLLAHNRELFDRYDRADAEATFRFVVALPLLVLSVLIPIRVGMPWWGYIISIFAGLVIAQLLIEDGARKRVESNDAVFQAVFVGEVAFPSIQDLRAGVSAQLQEDQERYDASVTSDERAPDD